VQQKVEATQEAMAAADATKQQAQQESSQYTQQLRDQAVARERDLHILREQYAAVQEACTKRIQDLQTRLTKLRERYRKLDQRRSMEMEGFTRDIAATKRNLQRLETALYGRRVGLRLQQQETESRRSSSFRNEILDSADLNDEIRRLQQRMAELAADVNAS
jgi:predicted aminopeptidase